MNLFDLILVQPIFNVLVFIYGVIPGHDFGIALILFTVLVRLVMWPLVKKQLHQTKVMRKIQPKLKKIKETSKGNKQLEAQLMMELYKEEGVNPFGPVGLLIVQMPVFIALFAVVRLMIAGNANILKYTYHWLGFVPQVKSLLANPHIFHGTLFGVVDLTKQAVASHSVYIPILLMAIVAAGFQYVQSKQLLPKVEEGRKLRDILKDQSGGKEVDQSEVSALMSNRMSMFFPFLTVFISVYLAGALVLYLLVTSVVAVIQQSIVLREDTEELEKIVDSTKVRAAQAQEAEIVKSNPKSKKTKRRKR